MRKIRGVCGLDQELTTRNVYDLLVVKILNAVLVDTFSSEFSFLDNSYYSTSHWLPYSGIDLCFIV